jgi:hypothetical protein
MPAAFAALDNLRAAAQAGTAPAEAELKRAEMYLRDFIGYVPGTSMAPQREKAENALNLLMRAALAGGAPAAPRATPEGNLALEHALKERDEARRQVRKLEAQSGAPAAPALEAIRDALIAIRNYAEQAMQQPDAIGFRVIKRIAEESLFAVGAAPAPNKTVCSNNPRWVHEPDATGKCSWCGSQLSSGAAPAPEPTASRTE